MDLFTCLSIKAIQIIWHGQIGTAYKSFFNIKCRYIPSCSNYAILAMQKYGFWIGGFKAVCRFFRCTNRVIPGTVDYP